MKVVEDKMSGRSRIILEEGESVEIYTVDSTGVIPKERLDLSIEDNKINLLIGRLGSNVMLKANNSNDFTFFTRCKGD